MNIHQDLTFALAFTRATTPRDASLLITLSPEAMEALLGELTARDETQAFVNCEFFMGVPVVTLSQSVPFSIYVRTEPIARPDEEKRQG